LVLNKDEIRASSAPQWSVAGYPVRLFIYDFDGVMTDNRVLVGEDGKESVFCNRSDGLAVAIIKGRGIPQVIISTETNKVIAVRSAKLDIPVIQGVRDKKETMLSYCKELNIASDEVLYIGNDINDLEVMQSVRLPVCPEDAYPEIKRIARFILPVAGGMGVIRELIRYMAIGSIIL
jgi:YrbI family 3-deoxy-D-manno-octulosonate 8-phosphate phosphatase